MPAPAPTATAVFDKLWSNQQPLRAQAVEQVGALAPTEKTRLRELLLSALRNEYSPEREAAAQDPARIRNNRCWLLSALGRAGSGDPATVAQVREHLDPGREPDQWVRFWALEGLVAGPAANLVEIAQQAVDADPDPLVKMLAHAVLADKGVAGHVEPLQQALAVATTPESAAAARALRVVHVAACVPQLLNLVSTASYTDATYDAVIALGRVPPDSDAAPAAAHRLAEFLLRTRPYAMWDSARLQAVRTLAKLGVTDIEPHLLAEIANPNPTIVRAAAKALTQLLGVRRTVERVLEMLVATPAVSLASVTDALRASDRDAVVNELETVLATAADPARKRVAQDLMIEMGGATALQKLRARTQLSAEYRQVLHEADTKLREALENTTREAGHGFWTVLVMNWIIFVLGVALLVGSAVAVWSGGKDFAGWVGAGLFGAAGFAGTLYSLFYTKPREVIEASVARQVEFKVVFLGFLRELNEIDQVFTRRLLEDPDFTDVELKTFCERVQAAVQQALARLRA